MKIGIIGGAGVRTPLLVNAITSSDLPISEIVLYDLDRPRLQLMTGLARHRAGSARLVMARNVADCVDGAEFVFISIRVGGIGMQIQDALAALSDSRQAPPVLVLGLPSEFLPHGAPDQILSAYGLDPAGILAATQRALVAALA